MLTRSFRVGRLLGIEVRLHWSLPLLALLPFWFSSPASPADLAMGFLIALFFMACVLLHELGHAIVARWQGITVRSIVLWPYGGFALLSRQPARLRDEIVIAAAGPAVNLAIVGLLLGLAWLVPEIAFGPSGMPAGFALTLLVRVWWALLIVNATLSILNLLPIYPLDGGRIGRALLQAIVGPRWANRLMLAVSLPLAIGLVALLALAGSWIDLPLGLLLILGAATLHPGVRNAINRAALRLTNPAAYALLRHDLGQAMVLADQRVAARPDDPGAYETRAVIALARKEYRQMLADADQVLRLQPERGLAHSGHAYAAFLAGDSARAQADLAAAARLDPANVQIPTVGGILALEASDLAGATAAFEQAVVLAPDHGMAYNNRGYLRFLRGDERGALADLERAEALNPELHQIYLIRGQIRLRQGDQTAALRWFDRAVRLEPHDLESYFFRARIYAAQGQPEQVDMEIDRALTIHAEEALVFKPFWLAFWLVGDLDWALHFYGRALAVRPGCAAAYHGRADALRVNGQLQAARDDYNQALAYDPGRAATYLARARTMLLLGAEEQAAADARHMLTLDITNDQRRAAQALLRSLGVPAL